MGKKKKRQARDKPTTAYCSLDNWDLLTVEGYTPLSKNPQIIAAVKKVANLIATCSIHLMENGESGDKRIQNGLSRLVDIDVNDYQTRFDFISGLVRALMLEGNGNALVYPKTADGYIEGLHLIPPDRVSYVQASTLFDYDIYVNGSRIDRQNYIHIRLNPDPGQPWLGTGYKAELRDVAKSLNQIRKTKDSFLESKWMPSIIIKIDGLVDEFASPEGRQQILDKYVKSQKAGEPWLIPADAMDLQTVKPLSLTDLAIKDGYELDTRAIAAILDVPAFLLGVGDFNKDAWNNFIQTRLPQITGPIEQAFTKNLLIAPNWYFRFNARSLMNWDIKTLAEVGKNLRQIGVMDGNEVRDMIGLSPREGLDEIVILENYLPSDRLGDQKKLTEGGEPDGKKDSDS